MNTIAVITCLVILVFLIAAMLLILADKIRQVVRQAALDYIEIWNSYHEKRIKLEKERER